MRKRRVTSRIGVMPAEPAEASNAEARSRPGDCDPELTSIAQCFLKQRHGADWEQDNAARANAAPSRGNHMRELVNEQRHPKNAEKSERLERTLMPEYPCAGRIVGQCSPNEVTNWINQ